MRIMIPRALITAALCQNVMTDLAVWNVRGLNKRDHQNAVRELITEFKLELIGLVETRVRATNVESVQRCIKNNWSWFTDYVSGPGNRLWLGWNDEEVDVQVLDTHQQYLHCKVEKRRTHKSFVLTVVYAANDQGPRKALWDRLKYMAPLLEEDSWLLMGDFNCVLDSSEICGPSAVSSEAMEDFSNCLVEARLVSLPVTGMNFTWHNCSLGARSLWKRLDRALGNEEWFAQWPQCSYHCTSQRTSDHCPLVLSMQQTTSIGTSCFRFDNFLVADIGFLLEVSKVWDHQVYGTPMYSVMQKLRALKPIFRRMRKQKGNLAQNVQQASDLLQTIQELQQQFPEVILLQEVEKLCRFIYSKAVNQEQEWLKQRSKLRWLKDGDHSTRLFFQKLAVQRARKKVFQLHTLAGNVLLEQDQIAQELVNWYSHLLGGSRSQRQVQLHHLEPFISGKVTAAEAQTLTLPVTAAEIKEALFSIADDKAPGPDGYSACFFKKAWPVVGQEITEAITLFFQSGCLLKQLNATFLTLVPKVHNPTTAADFRPIACCNVMYKVISKVLAHRLKGLLDKLVDYSQNAFIPGRKISDNVLLAQELLYGYNQNRLPPRCVMKIDIRKAYDTVEWDFLFAALDLFGFPSRFIGWISECVTTASYSILLNGRPHGFFSGTRGLRQGDPISPYLFVLVMEIFHATVKQHIHHSLDFQYHWRCKELDLFMLSFADDVLLFCQAHQPSIAIMKSAFDEFAHNSGLQANIGKSTIIFSKAIAQDAENLQTLMGFPIGKLPIKYLGVPLSSSRLTIGDCKPLLDKIEDKIAAWRIQHFSFAGRLQLIRSVLISFQTFWSSMFVLPKGVIKAIEQKLRSFLWAGSGDRYTAKVSWEQICSPKSAGGLGLPPLQVANKALICRHLWNVLNQCKSSIWVQWILSYRLKHLSIWTINTTVGSWSWKKMIKFRNSLLPALQYHIGSGETFSLWHDPWHPFGALIQRYPRGPSLTGLPLNAKLSSIIQQSEWHWPPITSMEILEVLQNLPTIHGGRDAIRWRGELGYSAVAARSLFVRLSPPVPWSSLLEGKFKIHRNLFVLWLAILERLSTLDKPWFQQFNQHCILCADQELETHSHLFFQCRFSRRCMAILHTEVKFNWPYHQWQQGISWASRKWRGNHLINAAYKATLASTVYHIWQERNKRRFQGLSSTPEVVSRHIIDQIRMRILSDELQVSLQSSILYRLWRLAWH